MISNEQLKEWRDKLAGYGFLTLEACKSLLDEVERLRADLKTVLSWWPNEEGFCNGCDEITKYHPDTHKLAEMEHAPSCLVTRYRALLEGGE